MHMDMYILISLGKYIWFHLGYRNYEMMYKPDTFNLIIPFLYFPQTCTCVRLKKKKFYALSKCSHSN